MRTYETWEESDKQAIKDLFGRRADTIGFISRALEVAYKFEAICGRGDQAIRDLATSSLPGDATFYLESDPDQPASTSNIAVLKEVRAHIRDFYQKQKTPSWFDALPWGATVGQVQSGLSRVGITLPRGYPFNPSLALLYGVPAQLADVEEILLNVPPPCPPLVRSLMEAVADLLGHVKIFSLPEDLAVFAFAAGTESIPRVDRIVGSGSAEGHAAALAVSQRLVVSLSQSTSRVVYVADASTDPRKLALDLLARVEISPHTLLAVVSPSMLVANELTDQVTRIRREDRECAGPLVQQLEEIGGVVMTRSMYEAIDLVNLYTPDEVVVVCEDPLSFLPRIGGGASVRLGRVGPPPLDWLDPTIDVLRPGGSTGFAGSPPTLSAYSQRSPFVHRTVAPGPAVWELADSLCLEAGLGICHKGLAPPSTAT